MCCSVDIVFPSWIHYCRSGIIIPGDVACEERYCFHGKFMNSHCLRELLCRISGLDAGQYENYNLQAHLK